MKILLAPLLLFAASDAVKFPYQNAIKVQKGAFKVGEFASLSCEYIKWKREKIQKVKWSVGYTGVSGLEMFTSYFEDGKKETQNSDFFEVDENSSGEKVMRVKLNEVRGAGQVNICCHVEGISDSLYGGLRKNEKEKCVPVLLLEDWPEVSLEVDRERVRVGEKLSYQCQVKNDVHNKMELYLSINGQDVNSTVSRKLRRIKEDIRITDEHFTSGSDLPQISYDSFNIDCAAKYGNHLISNHTLIISKDTRPLYESARPKSPVYSPRPYIPTTYRPRYSITTDRNTARQGRFYADNQAHGAPGNVPCNSYIVLEEARQGSVIRGDLPLDIQNNIQDLRLNNHRYETGEEAVNVLNILGFNGYKVVGNTINPASQRLIWTLERKYYEFHGDGHL